MRPINKIFISLLALLFSTFLIAVEAEAAKEKGDVFKEPKSIKVFSAKGEDIFSDGDWIGASKYFYKYFGKFEVPDKSNKVDY